MANPRRNLMEMGAAAHGTPLSLCNTNTGLYKSIVILEHRNKSFPMIQFDAFLKKMSI